MRDAVHVESLLYLFVVVVPSRMVATTDVLKGIVTKCIAGM